MSVTTLAPLKLLAFDPEDLAVLSAHLQDMVVQPGDFAWLASARTFAIAGERFDWIGSEAGPCERVECGLHFDRVLKVRRQAFERPAQSAPFNLLSLQFDTTEAPAGVVTMAFSGGATIRLDVECLEAQMRDLGPRRPCDGKPDHPTPA